ncbi:UNVERIFIED_CONTAM: hypothetical protein FKN15_037717 [Acipenser sinensis]
MDRNALAELLEALESRRDAEERRREERYTTLIVQLPVKFRITFKILLLAYKALHHTGPTVARFKSTLKTHLFSLAFNALQA